MIDVKRSDFYPNIRGFIKIPAPGGGSRLHASASGSALERPRAFRSKEFPPEEVKGKRQVRIRIRLNGVAVYKQIPRSKGGGTIWDYQVILFPSDRQTREVFRFKGNVGKRAAGLNSLFEKAGAMDVLSQ